MISDDFKTEGDRFSRHPTFRLSIIDHTQSHDHDGKSSDSTQNFPRSNISRSQTMTTHRHDFKQKPAKEAITSSTPDGVYSPKYSPRRIQSNTSVAGKLGIVYFKKS